MKIRILIILCLAAAVSLSSCHSSRHTVRGSDATLRTDDRDDIYVPADDGHNHRNHGHHDTADNSLIEYARTWLGTPYRYGGDDRGGVDCSGLTCAVYEHVLGIKLPRSSREQADYCKRIRRGDLRQGDLVFFTSKAGGSRINHVALYIGDNSIIHATSRGVTVSDLDEPYWCSHYYCCGRVRN